MRIITRNSQHSFLLFAVLIASSLVGCKTKEQTERSQDSASSAATAITSSPLQDTGALVGADELQLPSVPEVGVQRPHQAARKLPEEDEMDVRSPIRIKYIASSETSIRGVRLFITGIDREEKATAVHAFVQNEWGARTKIHPQPIHVLIPQAALSAAKLLDDQTGETHKADPSLAPASVEVTRSADWTLSPADRQMVTLFFGPTSGASHSATLIIPDFATVTGVPLP